MKFSETLEDMKSLADFAYSCHINEFVVCASAYQPWLDRIPGSTGGGRHYCLNRNNTLWEIVMVLGLSSSLCCHDAPRNSSSRYAD